MPARRSRQSLVAFVLAALAAVSPGFVSAQHATDEQVQRIFEAGMLARDQGDLDAARRYLAAAIAERPAVARLRFEYGVVRAQMGACLSAARALSTAKRLLPIPTIRRSAEAAMADLCPRLARFEGSLGVHLIHDTNPLSGAGSSSVVIQGMTFELDETARASTRKGIGIDGSLAYNHPLGARVFLVPTIDVAARKLSGEGADTLALGSGLFLRYRGDRFDLRAGPTISKDLTGGTDRWRRIGVALAGDYSLDAQSALSFRIARARTRYPARPREDVAGTDASLTYLREIGSRGHVGSLGVHLGRDSHEVAFLSMRTAGIRAGLRGPLVRSIGFDLHADYTRGKAGAVHPIFGVRRADRIITVGGALSFHPLETPFGRPHLGIVHTVSESTHPTKTFDRTRIVAGLTRSF